MDQVVGRIAWAALAPHTKGKIDERQYRLNIGKSLKSPATEEKRFKALAIASQVADRHKKRRIAKKQAKKKKPA
ncbi:MAG TPA: hypothetical protein PK402_09200 [Tepidisphaeraceae bacterium]|nr:hypothetical protein [Tepidisphaeraceae bacterium]